MAYNPILSSLYTRNLCTTVLIRNRNVSNFNADFLQDHNKSITIEKRPNENPFFSSFLIDNFNRRHTYLRISLTEKCNLRCGYCMPEEGVDLTSFDKLLTNDERFRIARLFVQNGVNKIRLTGGEPLIHRDAIIIIKKLNLLRNSDITKSDNILKEIAITTNGTVLKRKVGDLRKAGLDSVNISLDTLIPHKFQFISRTPLKFFDRIMDGIYAAVEAGLNPVKVNCVVMKNSNEDELCNFVEFTKKLPVDVRFIEFMPFDGNKWNRDLLVPYQEMLQVILQSYPDVIKLRDLKSDTSVAYKVPDYAGQFGFIASMTQPFCGDCNRLRITADGNLKVCLHEQTEVPLLDPMRSGLSDNELLQIIGDAVKQKKRQHAGMHVLANTRNRCMTKHEVRTDQFYAKRHYSSRNSLTHVDNQGKASMVDISRKQVTNRHAVAVGCVVLNESAFNAVQNNNISKGDVLTVAKIAGIMGAKRCSDLVPLCHSLSLASVDVQLNLNCDKKAIEIKASVSTADRTGVEMEALTAVSVAALTIYDMCKAIGRDTEIKNIKLEYKSGGNSGEYKAN